MHNEAIRYVTPTNKLTPSQQTLRSALYELGAAAHRQSAKSGFWDMGVDNRNKGEMVALMHSELSELLEGIRKPQPDSHCPDFTSEEVEMADLLIRAADYWQAFGLRIDDAIRAKMAYNASRPPKHGKAF